MIPTQGNVKPEDDDGMLKWTSEVSSKLPEILEPKSLEPMWDLYL